MLVLHRKHPSLSHKRTSDTKPLYAIHHQHRARSRAPTDIYTRVPSRSTSTMTHSSYSGHGASIGAAAKISRAHMPDVVDASTRSAVPNAAIRARTMLQRSAPVFIERIPCRIVNIYSSNLALRPCQGPLMSLLTHVESYLGLSCNPIYLHENGDRHRCNRPSLVR